MTADHSAVDPRYVAARRILLDALAALAPHGARSSSLARKPFTSAPEALTWTRSSPFTTDGDLAVNPGLLGDDPQLEAAMTEAGFHLKLQPGGHVEPGIRGERSDSKQCLSITVR